MLLAGRAARHATGSGQRAGPRLGWADSWQAGGRTASGERAWKGGEGEVYGQRERQRGKEMGGKGGSRVGVGNEQVCGTA